MATKIDRLSFQMEADVSQFEQGMRLTRNELRAVNRAMRSSEEPAEKLTRDINALEEAVAAGGKGADEYRERLERLRKRQSDMQKEQSGLNREMREAQKIIDRTKNETEKFNESADRAAELLDKGHISAEQYRREIDRLESELGGVDREQNQVNDELRKAEDITRRVETASERYAREVADLNRMLARGRISQHTYSRALKQQKADLMQARAATAANVPVVGNFASSMVSGGLAVGGAGLAVAGLTSGLYALERAASFALDKVSDQMEEVDELAKQSRFLGLSANDLQAFRLAGEEFAGLDMRQVDVGLQRVVRRLSEAAAGTGEAKAAFKELGIDAAAIAQLPTGDALLQIADSLSQVDDEGERVRLAFKLLDAEGARLALAFSDGSASIEEMRKTVKELGLEISDFEAEQVEAANDAIGRLQKSMSGLGRTAAVEFSNDIEAASQNLQEFISGVDGGISGFRQWAAVAASSSSGITGPIGNLARSLLEANTERANEIRRAAELDKQLEELNGGEDGPPSMISDAEAEQLETAQTELQSLRSELEKLQGQESPIIDTEDVAMLQEAKQLAKEIEQQKAENKANDRLDSIRQEMQMMGMTADEAERFKFALSGATEEQQRQFAILQQQQNAMEKDAKEQEELQKQGDALAEQFEAPAEKLKRELADLKKLRDVGAIDGGTFQKAARQAAKQFQEATGKATAMQELGRPGAAEQGSQEAINAIQGIQDKEAQAQREQAEREKQQLGQNKVIIQVLKNIEREGRNAQRLQGVG